MADETPGAEVVDTADGPVQVAVFGEGPAVLAVHGSPGGYDAAVAMGRFAQSAGMRVIAPSRPGYLGTPLDGRTEIDRQADLLAALLDALEVDTVGVLGWSGGGPSSYRLAARHPERVRGLVVTAGVSRHYEAPSDDLEKNVLLASRGGNAVLRVIIAHAPKQMVKQMVISEGDLPKEKVKEVTERIFADPDKRAFALAVAATATFPGRREGYDNDMARFAEIESLGLETIAVPTLIVHGTADAELKPADSEFAAGAIPAAELVLLEDGTHLAFWTHADAASAQARALEILG